MCARLTPAQARIVDTLDRPLFVAAGAGSGKSTTLAERVAHAFEPGTGGDGAPFLASLDQVLVITFTHAAAEEIREKIRARLREGGLDQEALKVDSAWISTIHGMCSRILRAHAYDLGLDPRFQMVESTVADQMQEAAIDETLREIQDGGEFPGLREAFPLRRRGFSGESDTSVFGMVETLRRAAAQSVAGFDSLEFPGTMPDVDFELGALRDVQMRALGTGRSCKAFASAKGTAEEAALEQEVGLIEGYLAQGPGLHTPQTARELLGRLRQKPGDAYRKADMKPLKEELARAYASAGQAISFAASAPFADELVEIAKRVDGRYRAAKDEAGVMDSDDLLTRCLAAFRDHPEIAAEYSDRFRLVMVDEFQDTNQQQVEMVSLLSGRGACHLATVGDAQQSIYRFRGADVTVFTDREREVDQTWGGESIVRMDMNFRSHADILSFVDTCFSGGYLPGFMSLAPCPTRKDTYRARDLPRVRIEATLGKTGTTDMRRLLSARQMAGALRSYLDHGHVAGDVAVLLGSLAHVDVYLDALREQGIECVVTGGSTFSQAGEVGVVAALLHVLANPQDTQAGLYPVLSSGLFELDADDLLALSTCRQETLPAPANRSVARGLLDWDFVDGYVPSRRMAVAHDVLTRAFSRMGSWALRSVMTAVLRESGWLSRLEREGATGQAKAANALAAVRFAADLAEQTGLGPARAAVEFDHWLQVAKEGPASLAGGTGDVAKVMTIHASKGLEFPVVAVGECWDRDGTARAGVTCENMGRRTCCTLVPPEVAAKDLLDDPPLDPPAHGSRTDWAGYLVNASVAADDAEGVRLLYVALTRAREALVCAMATGVDKDGNFSSRLMQGLGANLFADGTPAPGERLLDYGYGSPVALRCVLVTKERGTGDYVVDSGGSLELGGDRAEGADGSQDGGDSGAPRDSEPYVRMVELFDEAPGDGLAAVADMAAPWMPREGIYSYSSAHRQMLEAYGERLDECGDKGGPVLTGDPGDAATRFLQDAWGTMPHALIHEADDMDDAEAPGELGDEDRATDLGSAFHELAQAMVECGGEVDAGRVGALARTWGLSRRQYDRLSSALALWTGSDVRREALAHAHVSAEVPFFQLAPTGFGSWVEGAIDLLAWDERGGCALVVDYKTGDKGLTVAQVESRHRMQANFYASVLMRAGFSSVECAFVCVEVPEPGSPDQPHVARYAFDAARPPVM